MMPVEMAAQLSKGLVEVILYNTNEQKYFSTKAACAKCGYGFPDLEPRIFSFNSPHGACENCNGLGEIESFDPLKIIPDHSLSLNENAIIPWFHKSPNWRKRVLEPLSKKYGFSLDSPLNKLSKKILKIILYGSGKEEVSFRG